jgi:hypothetical protein
MMRTSGPARKWDDDALDQERLFSVAEEIVGDYRPALEREGWTIVVELKVRPPGGVGVQLEHPLVPGSHGFNLRADMTEERVRRFLVGCFEDHYDFDVVRDAPVRSERQRLLRHLRGAALRRGSADAVEAIVSAGYTLYEEGVLLREEADWLSGAMDRDMDEDQRFHRE